jgi:hypothetical protein
VLLDEAAGGLDATEARELDGTLPVALRLFYRAVKARPHERLSDFFEEVMSGLGEAEA